MTTKTEFSEPEARRTAIRMILKAETQGDPVLIAAILEAQEEAITQLDAAVRMLTAAVRKHVKEPLPEFALLPAREPPADGGSNREHPLYLQGYENGRQDQHDNPTGGVDR